MIKVSEHRSAIRRAVLVKCANEYNRLLDGYANSQRGLVRAGTRIAVQDAKRRSRPPVAPRPAPRVPVTTPAR